MERLGIDEVLEQGTARSRRSHATASVVSGVIAIGITLAALAAALGWWASRPPTSAALEILDASVIGTQPVTVIAEPPLGALATPAGAALPGITVRLRVGGDPSTAMTVETSPLQSRVYVEEQAPVTIAAGAFADVDVTVTPVDCTVAADSATQTPDLEVLRTATGVALPLSDPARSALLDALGDACAQAGPAPTLSVTGARRGGQSPLETISLIVDVDAVADRLVLTPLDTPGLRGLGAAARATGEGIPLLWLVSPEAGEGTAIVYAQVYVVRAGTAYPWIVGIPITDDLPAMIPLTPSIR